MINYKLLQVEKILELDNLDYSISLSEKIIKLGEEIGEMSASKYYFTRKEYIEETFDAFNISLAVYNTIREQKVNLELLEHSIDKVLPDNKLEMAIPIFYGKICASLLLKIDSHSKSRSSLNTDIESYSFELILLLASQLKYIIRDDIDFSQIVNSKLDKWEEKQKEYLSL